MLLFIHKLVVFWRTKTNFLWNMQQKFCKMFLCKEHNTLNVMNIPIKWNSFSFWAQQFDYKHKILCFSNHGFSELLIHHLGIFHSRSWQVQHLMWWTVSCVFLRPGPHSVARDVSSVVYLHVITKTEKLVECIQFIKMECF